MKRPSPTPNKPTELGEGKFYTLTVYTSNSHTPPVDLLEFSENAETVVLQLGQILPVLQNTTNREVRTLT